MLKRFYARFPLFDRYTYYYDSQYNVFTGLYWGIAIPMQKLLVQLRLTYPASGGFFPTILVLSSNILTVIDFSVDVQFFA